MATCDWCGKQYDPRYAPLSPPDVWICSEKCRSEKNAGRDSGPPVAAGASGCGGLVLVVVLLWFGGCFDDFQREREIAHDKSLNSALLDGETVSILIFENGHEDDEVSTKAIYDWIKMHSSLRPIAKGEKPLPELPASTLYEVEDRTIRMRPAGMPVPRYIRASPDDDNPGLYLEVFRPPHAFAGFQEWLRKHDYGIDGVTWDTDDNVMIGLRDKEGIFKLSEKGGYSYHPLLQKTLPSGEKSYIDFVVFVKLDGTDYFWGGDGQPKETKKYILWVPKVLNLIDN